MHFCILGVDTCVVWSSIECQRYAKAYRVPESRFLFVPHHHTTMHYQFEVEDGGYLFTGGNWSRDYELFLEAVHDVDFPCILATNRPELLSGLEIPKHVRVISATHSEFRELLARSAFLVLPMQANLLHAGGQQTMLNAMMMRKPVVLTDVEGGADYIDHGRTGFLVPYRDAKALREIINFLVANPAERERVGRNASEAALSLTTERCNTTIWVEVLRLVEQSRQEKGLTTEGTLIV
jgi:glycosyltransferase involved in cell wall biosynthesis